MTELMGTGTLIRLILRRDWLKLLIWVGLIGLVPIGIASSFAELYPTAEAINTYADEVMRTPATVGMLGPVFSRSLGGLIVWWSGLNGAIRIAPVALLFLIRYTRTEEEAGRRELLGSTVVGPSQVHIKLLVQRYIGRGLKSDRTQAVHFFPKESEIGLLEVRLKTQQFIRKVSYLATLGERLQRSWSPRDSLREASCAVHGSDFDTPFGQSIHRLRAGAMSPLERTFMN